MQFTPSPSNPLLHVQIKLLITSAHVAFTWQLSISSSHSSTSMCRVEISHMYALNKIVYYEIINASGGQLPPFEKDPQELLTCAVDSISIKSIVAYAYKATDHISTGGIHMAVVHIQFTLINVCMWRWIFIRLKAC